MVILLVFFTFAVFVTLDYFLNKEKARERTPQVENLEAEKFESTVQRLVREMELRIPRGVLVSRGHIWTKIMPHGEVRIGLDDLCPKLLSRIDSIKFYEQGYRLEQKSKMLEIGQGKKTLSFFAPFEGIIVSVNPEVLKNPRIICQSPYDKGWIYSVKPTFDLDYIVGLQTSESITSGWQEKEREKLTEFLLSETSSKEQFVAQGRQAGFSLKGLLDTMDGLTWLKFEENFLR